MLTAANSVVAVPSLFALSDVDVANNEARPETKNQQASPAKEDDSVRIASVLHVDRLFAYCILHRRPL